MKAKSFSQEKNVAANQNIKEREYWLNQLSGEWEKSVFLYDNPTAEPGTVGNKWRLEEMDFKLSAPLCERLLHMANGSDTRLYCLILTAVTVLIDKYTGNNDIIVGAPIYRQKKEDEGDFINTVLTLRNRIGTGVTFKELLITVSKNLFEVTEHQNYPVKTLLYKLNIPFSENDFFPLFDIVILLENIHDKNYILDIKTNIVFSFSRDGREVKGTMEYNRFLYREKTIQRIINHFKHLLHIALFNIDIQVSSIDLSTNKEKKRLLLDFNDTAREYPGDQTVHQLFEKQVTQTPEHIAVVGKEQHITYRELNKKANQLARFLRKKGVKPDVIVGLMVDRSLEMIIGILGVLKAGGSYLSIDPGTPKKRALLMLEDGAASLVLTKKNLDKDFEYSILATGYLNPAKPYLGPPRQSIKDLNHLPIPDRTLVDYEKYNQYIGQVMAKDCLSIQATRGCPYKCAYCHKIWPKNHVVRTAENILSEIKLFYDMGVRRFSFVDDIFNLDRSNSTHFFQLIKKNGLDLQLFFPNGLRGDQLTRDFIDLMVEVGTVNLTLSLETASPRLQKLIGKNLDIEKLRENILYICETYPQVILELQTMHGLPTETEEEALMTLKFLKSTQWLHFAYVNILIIYPNTDMMKIALENGIIYEQIAYSNRRAAHELPDTLPFKKSFTTKYQSEFLNEYFLLKDRLLHVLPYQMKIMTRDEMVQKYNSYLPTEINRFSDLLQLANIRTNELTHHEFVSDHKYAIPNLNEKIKKIFPPKSKKPSPQALKILFLDLSQFFSGESDMLYDVVEPPLGLMYLCTYLNREFCNHIRSRITKSRIDFDDYNRLKNLLGTFKPDIIGVRTLTFYKDFFHKTIAFIRQWGFRGPIIAGGPYATSDYNTLLQDRNIDLAALGEGEITLSEVVKKILENDGNLPPEPVLKEIPGIAFMPKSNASKTNVNRDIICLDEQENIFSRESPENPEPVNQPDDLAYTIFTSGSTGRPKGAMIRHQGLTNYIWWAANTFVKEEKTDFPLYTSYAFDLTVTSIFTPLITGNAIVLYEGDDKEILIENVIEENRVGVLKATPSHLKLVRDKKPGNSSIKRIISGGEVLETGLAKEITRNFHHKVTIYNEYGPTETVVGSMIYQFNEETDNKKCVPIGVPIDNVQIYILDEYLEPAPIGVAGELVIAGDGVARGYLNNPELTAKKFDHDSWDYQDYHDEKRRVKIKKNNQKCTTFNRSYKSYKSYISQKKYKTGDLARWLPEGKIELLGRSDQQVKIRGFRIEPGEIEQQMMRQPDIKEAAVIARKDEEGHVYLCAYYVPTVISAPGEGVNISEMRQHLSLTLTLPDYMIPSHFVRQERMPLTSNGKLDRTRLPAPQALIDSKNYVPPRNDTEEKLAEIWQDILGIDKSKIGIANNFFELGGHSLKAVLLISRIHKELNVKVSLADIFETQDIQKLSGLINENVRDRDTYQPILKAAEKEYYPLSISQEGLFVLQKYDPKSMGYNTPISFILEEALDKRRLEDTYIKLIHRHESLRTSFEQIEGNVVQRIHRSVEFALEYKEINEQEFNQTVRRFVRPFDLSQAPLFRAMLIHLKAGKPMMIIDMHHIITDGTSTITLIKEFMALYGDEILSPLRLQYKDFSEWQNDEKQKKTMLKQETFWLKELEGNIPVVELPIDYERPLLRSFAGHQIYFDIGPKETRALKEIASNEGATLFMVLLALFNVFLMKITGQEEIVVGVPLSGRHHADLEGIIGMFVNMLVFKNSPRAGKTFRDFFREVIEKSLGALENQDYPYEKLVERLSSKWDMKRNPLFDVSFGFHNMYVSTSNLSGTEIGDLNVQFYQHEYNISKFDMSFSGVEIRNTLNFTIEYCTKLFRKEKIKRFVGYFKEVLAAIVENKDIKLAEIKITHDIMAAEKKIPQSDFEFQN